MGRDGYGQTALQTRAHCRDAGDEFFDLGMSCMTGRSGPIDLVSAHKWFNVAAIHGNKDAIRLRREIAAEMSMAEITTAQRAARDWITRH